VKPLLAMLIAALAVPAVAYGYASFRAPGRNVYCGLSDPKLPATLICWRASDGLSLGMNGSGTALPSPDRNNRGFHQNRARVLQFGQSWRRGPYRCTALRSGVRCKNTSGHGWLLGLRRGYKVF
jgi:hypothetical protein